MESAVGTVAAGKPTRRWVVVTVGVVGTIVSMATTRVIWPDPPDAVQPGGLLPLFIIIGAVESIGFGLGLAFLVSGLGYLRGPGTGSWLTIATYVSVVWLLVSWWPHDNLHRVLSHDDLAGLLRIEYGFHVTLIAAGAIVALFFVRSLASRHNTEH